MATKAAAVGAGVTLVLVALVEHLQCDGLQSLAQTLFKLGGGRGCGAVWGVVKRICL